MRFHTCLAVAALFGVGLIAAPSAAKDQPVPKPAQTPDGGPSAADKETARNLMDRGNSLFDEANYAEALTSYEAADKIVGVTSTGFAVGKTLVKLGRLLEARDKLLAVTRIPAAPDESPILTEARNKANQMQDEIAAKIPTLTFKLEGVEEGDSVTIKIGDYAVPTAAVTLPQRVDPGTRRVTASCPGYKEFEVTVVILEGEDKSVVLRLVKKIGGDVVPPPDDGVSPLMVIGFGTAGLGLLVGSITGGVSLAMASEVESNCIEPDRTQCLIGDEDKADTSILLAHVSTASFALAGAGAVVGLIGLLTGGDDEPTADPAAALGVTVEPVVGLGSVGIRGTF